VNRLVRSAILSLVVLGVAAACVHGVPIKIGICKIVEHPALDAVEQGAIDALTAAGYVEGKDVQYLKASAQGDYNVAISIAQNYQAQHVDLVLAIATPTALAAAQVFRGTTTPIVFAAITAPEEYGLVLDAHDPSRNENITGVSDRIDVALDLKLLKDLSPSIKRIGLVYNPGEVNSDLLTRLAEQSAPSLGLTIVKAIADTSAAVLMAAQSLIGRVDAFFVTTDNTVVSAIDSVVAAANEARVPFLMADYTSVRFGPTVARGFDYYEHGQIAGSVILEVLSGKKPNQIPVVYHADVEREKVYLNLDAAAKIAFTFPQAVVDQADGLYFAGAMWDRNPPLK
jgi:putative ABC transport system substrate-binding protein